MLNISVLISDLTDSDILKLSMRLTNKSDLRILGVGLRLESYVIESIMYDNRNDISNAAYRMLNEWYMSQANRKIAYTNLHDALECAGMRFLAYELREQFEIS